MNVFRELRRRQQFGRIIRVAVVGAGSMGRGIVSQLNVMPGLLPAILVNRTVAHAMEAWMQLGFAKEDVVVSDDTRILADAVQKGVPAISRDSCVASAVSGIEVVVESTGTLAPAARTVLSAIHAGKHVVVMNSALDATVGCYLCERARQQGVVYSHADGAKPGALMRLLEWVAGLNFEVIAAVNCHGYLDVESTPEASWQWAKRLNASSRVACAAIDGTTMNLENAVVSNATGLVPEVRGMHGVRTTREDAVRHFTKTLRSSGVVDYTVGGDFGGGVFVIGRCPDMNRIGRYLDTLKLGDGPEYLFLRPYHLGIIETPLSVVEAVLYREPTIAPRGAPIAEVIAIAKRDLFAGECLDGIGGATVYGQIERVSQAIDFLPIGLSEGVRLNAPVLKGKPIPRMAAAIDDGGYLENLARLPEMLFGTLKSTTQNVTAAIR